MKRCDEQLWSSDFANLAACNRLDPHPSKPDKCAFPARLSLAELAQSLHLPVMGLWRHLRCGAEGALRAGSGAPSGLINGPRKFPKLLQHGCSRLGCHPVRRLRLAAQFAHQMRPAAQSIDPGAIQAAGIAHQVARIVRAQGVLEHLFAARADEYITVWQQHSTHSHSFRDPSIQEVSSACNSTACSRSLRSCTSSGAALHAPMTGVTHLATRATGWGWHPVACVAGRAWVVSPGVSGLAESAGAALPGGLALG